MTLARHPEVVGLHHITWRATASAVSNVEVLAEAMAWLIGDEEAVELDRSTSYHGPEMTLVKASTANKRRAARSFARLGEANLRQLIDEFDHRVCYAFSSASYNYVDRCANGWSSTGSSRVFNNGLEEHGYYYGSVDGGDFTGKAVMIDAPNWYLDGDTYEWNGTTMIWTGSWSTNDLSRVYPRYNGEVNVYLHDSTIQGMSLNDDGELAIFGHNKDSFDRATAHVEELKNSVVEAGKRTSPPSRKSCRSDAC